MQQQLAQVVSDNQALVGALFQLQAALGLPQALPDCMQASTQCQHSWQAYEYQAPTCTQPVSSPKQRKPRRHSKHQQQQDKQQHQQQPDLWAGSSYAGSVEPDMSDPAAAAAAPVAELPVQLVSKVQAAAAASGQAHLGSAAAAPAPAAPGTSASALPSVGTTEPPGSGASSGRALQLSSKQHQWHTGLHIRGSNSTTPAVASQLQTSSAAAAAAAFAPAAAAAAQPVPCVQPTGAAGLSTPTAADAAALLGQLPTPGADAVMGDAEDDITMLGVFLAGEDELDPAAAAAATPAAVASTAEPAAAGMQSYAAGGPALGAAAGGQGASLAAGWPGSAAGSSLPNHCSPQAAVAGAAPEVRVGSRSVFKTSPALSDPAGLECWGRDDISSSSVGGSLTHSHTPSLTPSGRPCIEPVNGVNPAYARAGGWQQQQYAGAGQGGAHTGVSGTAAVSPQVAAAAAAAAGGRALAPEQLTTPHVSPITPVSSRVRTPSASGAGAAAASTSAYPGDCALQANLALHHQQQQGVGFMLGDVNPAAAVWGRGRHARSASTGCVGGWQGYEQVGLPWGPEVALQQQQQQQEQEQSASMLAAQHQHQQQGHALHAGHQAAAVVGAAPAPGAMASVAGQRPPHGPMPPELAMGASQQVSWQRHRRSHSHAAAFMGQYELSMVQEQQLYYSGSVSHQGQPEQQGLP